MYSDMSIRSTARSSSKSSVRERARELGLADARGAEEEERPDRPIGVAESRARAPDGVRDGLEPPGPDRITRLVQARLQLDELLHLALEQARDRDARPGRHDLGDVVRCDLLVEQALGAEALECRLLVLELACELGQPAVAQLGGTLEIAVALRALGLPRAASSICALACWMAPMRPSRPASARSRRPARNARPRAPRRGQRGAPRRRRPSRARARHPRSRAAGRRRLRTVELVRDGVVSMRSRLAALSTRSIALSGRKRSATVTLRELGGRDQRARPGCVHRGAPRSARGRPRRNRDRVRNRGLAHEHGREAPLERRDPSPMCLRYSSSVRRADRAQLARATSA